MISPVAITPPPRERKLLPTIAASFTFALVIALACRWAGGDSLGFFFGPVLLLTIVMPQLALAALSSRARLVACGTVVVTMGAAWAVGSGVELSSTIRCTLVFAAWTLALVGIAAALARMRIHAVPAAAWVSVVGLAWLTWPIWLSAALPTHVGDVVLRTCAPIHPLFAINGVMRERFDTWDRYRLAYQQLTTLNQDVLYTLPRSIWPAVCAYGFIGVLALRLRTRTVVAP